MLIRYSFVFFIFVEIKFPLKIIRSVNNDFESGTVVTIGTFDGVHIGHQKIIKKLISSAKDYSLKSVVLTFFPHPRMVIQKDVQLKLINTLTERSDILDELKLDFLVIKKFTKTFSRLTADDFVKEVLVDELHVKKIIIGYDHHFGRNRTANIEDLKRFGEQYNFEVEEISAQDINDVAISSTKIRAALDQGDVKTANLYLGYNFMITGSVVHGKNLGTQIGFPTANLVIEEPYKLIPKQGVYIVKSTIKNKPFFGMMNIGTNPTIEQNNTQSIEVHFFNFNEAIYGELIKVELLERLRDEQKFESLEALKAQLINDQKSAGKIIAKFYAQ